MESEPRYDALWRIESPKLIAALTRMTRDVGLAEDLAQEAFIAAVQQWPKEGRPDNPGAWLMAAAKHRAVDALRRKTLVDKKNDEVETVLELSRPKADLDAQLDEDVGDDLLRLVLISCHPVLATDARVALTLRLLGGLTTDEIARAFLTPEPTIAQRIVRAKKTLADARAAFEVPRGAALQERLASVLEVLYLVFNEGYSATAGDDWMRPALCEDAVRLGRVLVGLVPKDAEAHGLLALMELQASRAKARLGPDGEPVLLSEQNRGRWDPLLISRGLLLLEKAEALSSVRGPYTLQAAIAACHVRALTVEQTDWVRIVALYEALALQAPSPVVELNHAVAAGMAFGPAAGLSLIDGLRDEPKLQDYHLLYAVRADLLLKLGRVDEAKAELMHAASLTKNERERKLLLERAARS